ncbi:hypothetical protein C0995_004588, partial [Termitomyces sp. Mi166
MRANGDIQSITEDGITQIAKISVQFELLLPQDESFINPLSHRKNATWGLARLASHKKLHNQDP